MIKHKAYWVNSKKCQFHCLCASLWPAVWIRDLGGSAGKTVRELERREEKHKVSLDLLGWLSRVKTNLLGLSFQADTKVVIGGMDCKLLTTQNTNTPHLQTYKCSWRQYISANLEIWSVLRRSDQLPPNEFRQKFLYWRVNSPKIWKFCYLQYLPSCGS